MSLILPPFQFAELTTNVSSSTLSASTEGTVVNAAILTGGAKGTTVGLITPDHDVHYLTVHAAGYNVTGTATGTVMDIMIDRAGGTAWSVFIADLLVGYSVQHTGVSAGGIFYQFPVWLPSGTSIGVRATSQASSSTLGSGNVAIWAAGEPSRPEMWWCGQGVETLGVTSTAAVGTSVLPGNAGVMGAWTNIGSVTSAQYGSIQVGLGGFGATQSAFAYTFQVGALNQQVPGLPEMYRLTMGAEIVIGMQTGPSWCDIAKGTQLQLRGTCSTAAQTMVGGAAFYGVY